MCSINEDIHIQAKPDLKYKKIEIRSLNYFLILNKRLFRKCLKCDQKSVVVTRINDALCK